MHDGPGAYRLVVECRWVLPGDVLVVALWLGVFDFVVGFFWGDLDCAFKTLSKLAARVLFRRVLISIGLGEKVTFSRLGRRQIPSK